MGGWRALGSYVGPQRLSRDGCLMGRPRLAPGESGDAWVVLRADGRYQARCRVRDIDGRVREVSALGATEGDAKREMQRRLDARRCPSATTGVRSEMTLDQLGGHWIRHRQRHGKARFSGRLRDSTLAAYDAALRTVVSPALGGLRVCEVDVGLLEAVLGDIEARGRSTAQVRSVLSQMLGLAVRDGALDQNPMLLVAPPAREARDVKALTIESAHRFRALIDPATQRINDRRGPNTDLAEVCDTLLGTGTRIGECLALRWVDLGLTDAKPLARICGTLVEPRKGFVEKLHRQDLTKSGAERTLILPDHVVELLLVRRKRASGRRLDAPVFASRNGGWLWPNNLRTRLRRATHGDSELDGTTPHTLRRTVGTLVAHEAGLDAARDVLGHSDPSVTFQSYVAPRAVAPDVRDVLGLFFV